MRLQVALFVLCALTLCDQTRGSHRTAVPSTGLRMPNRRYILKWDTFVNKIPGRTWSTVLLLPINASFPEIFRFDIHPVMTGQHTYDAHQVFRFGELGPCISQVQLNLQHAPEDKYAIDRLDTGAGTAVEAYFSFDPNLSYFFIVSCNDETTIVNGVCTQNGALGLLVRDFPPNQLNWGMIVHTLKKVMGFDFTDSRFRWITGAEELAPVATSMFDDDKNILKKELAVERTNRGIEKSAVFLDGCAVLWDVEFPIGNVTVHAYIDAFRKHARRYQMVSDVYIIFDRYISSSPMRTHAGDVRRGQVKCSD